ncbi:MAG: hypothetical protein WAM39_16040 [Bryobacteraceae bacterium]
MSTKSISIVNSSGLRAATPDSIPLAKGDTLTFSTDTDAPTLLCFAPETVEILSPSPGGQVSIAAGASVSFTVGPVANATYCSAVAASDAAPPDSFDCKGMAQSGPTLVIRTGGMQTFSGPNWQTGR